MVNLVEFSLGVGDEQINPSVVIVIRPSAHPRIAEIIDNGAAGDFGKAPVPLIMIEEVFEVSCKSPVGDKYIQKAVVVVVCPSQAAGITVIAEDGANHRRVGKAKKSAITYVVKDLYLVLTRANCILIH